MRANNSFHLEGRLAADPETTSGNVTRTKIRLAVDGWDRSTRSKKTDFINVTVFGKDAERVDQYAKKGTYLSVVGELRKNQWTDKAGQKRDDIQLVASDVHFGPKAQGPVNDEEDGEGADPFGFGS